MNLSNTLSNGSTILTGNQIKLHKPCMEKPVAMITFVPSYSIMLSQS